MNKVFIIKNKLRQARKLIKNGWTQGVWNEHNCYCTLGAIRTATGVHKPGASAMKHDCSQPDYDLCWDVEEFLRTKTGLDNPIPWNDENRRTKADVLAAFDKAIAS